LTLPEYGNEKVEQENVPDHEVRGQDKWHHPVERQAVTFTRNARRRRTVT